MWSAITRKELFVLSSVPVNAATAETCTGFSEFDGKYTIFGQVVSGMDVADIIVNAEKNPGAGRDAPRNPVAIDQTVIIDGVGGLTADEKAAWDEMPADLKPVQ